MQLCVGPENIMGSFGQLIPDLHEVGRGVTKVQVENLENINQGAFLYMDIDRRLLLLLFQTP